jgi:PilZ domain
MPLDYSEKRNFFRMNIDCDMEYSLNGSSEKAHGTVLNLSGDGVSFTTKEHVNPGTMVSISIAPENTVTPPLEVTVEVLRCETGDHAEQYEIAGNIIQQ